MLAEQLPHHLRLIAIHVRQADANPRELFEIDLIVHGIRGGELAVARHGEPPGVQDHEQVSPGRHLEGSAVGRMVGRKTVRLGMDLEPPGARLREGLERVGPLVPRAARVQRRQVDHRNDGGRFGGLGKDPLIGRKGRRGDHHAARYAVALHGPGQMLRCSGEQGRWPQPDAGQKLHGVVGKLGRLTAEIGQPLHRQQRLAGQSAELARQRSGLAPRGPDKVRPGTAGHVAVQDLVHAREGMNVTVRDLHEPSNPRVKQANRYPASAGHRDRISTTCRARLCGRCSCRD